LYSLLAGMHLANGLDQFIGRQVFEEIAASAGLKSASDVDIAVEHRKYDYSRLRKLSADFDRGVDSAQTGQSLADLIATGKYLKGGSQELRYQETMKVGALDSDAAYLSRLETQRMVRRLLVELMDRYSVDVLVYPVKALPAPMVGGSDDGSRDNPISSATGLPAVVLPAGLNEEGLPLALEFLGRPFSEPILIQLAYSYERATHARVAPKTTPHLSGELFEYK
jgi:Asp-tRNA(Asn)/Glu-tRNA(Gln) amidotransferase A subunit family amidase